MKSVQKFLLLVPLLLQTACSFGLADEKQIMETVTTFPGPALTAVYDGNAACPNISGNYRDKDVLLLSQFPSMENRNGIVIKEEILNGKLIYPGQGLPFYYHDTLQFYQQAVLGVKQKGRTLVITLMDKEHVPYKTISINLNNPMIGCHDGALVIRESLYSWGGGPGSMGWAFATERTLRKRSDGSLESKSDKRQWYCHYSRGLIGYGPDNSPSGNEPRTSKSMVIFPMVK